MGDGVFNMWPTTGACHCLVIQCMVYNILFSKQAVAGQDSIVV